MQRTPHRVGYSRRTGALLTLLPTSLFPPHLIYALLTLLCVCVCVCVKFCHRGGAGIHTQRCQAVWPAHHQFLHIFYVFIFILCYFFFLFFFFFFGYSFVIFFFQGCALIVVLPPGEALYISSLSLPFYTFLSFFLSSFFLPYIHSLTRAWKILKKQQPKIKMNVQKKKKKWKKVEEEEGGILF